MNYNGYVNNEHSRFEDVQLNKMIKEKIGYLNDFKKQFGYNQELINLLALINVAFKENNIEIDDLFYSTIRDTQIFTGKGDINDVIKLYNNNLNVNFDSNILASFSTFTNVDLFENEFSLIKPKIFLVDDNKFQKNEKFNILIHELRHALTSQKKSNYFLNEDTYYKRSGLEYCFIRKNIDQIYNFNLYFEEAFNEYSSIVLLNTILNYKNSKIENNEIIKLLHSIKGNLKNGHYNSSNYEDEREIIEPFLNKKEIVETLNKISFTGETHLLDSIIPNFDEYSEDFDFVSDYHYNDAKTYDKEYHKKLLKLKSKSNEIARM